MEKKDNILEMTNPSNIRTVTPITKQTGVKFNPEKAYAQIQAMSDTSLEHLYRLVRRELKDRKDEWELAAFTQEKSRQEKSDKERKEKLHGINIATQGKMKLTQSEVEIILDDI